jgi:hypothetical protein
VVACLERASNNFSPQGETEIYPAFALASALSFLASFLSGQTLLIRSNQSLSPGPFSFHQQYRGYLLSTEQVLSTHSGLCLTLFSPSRSPASISAMPPTKSQKAAKATDTEDDNQGFVEKQKGMYKAVSSIPGDFF